MDREMAPGLKRCVKCDEMKSLLDFSVRSDTGRRRNECRECRLKYGKKYRETHKEKAQQKGREYRLAHKKELDEYRLRWQRANKDKVKRYQKKYSENMSSEQRERQRLREKRYRDKNKDNQEYLQKRRQWSRDNAKRRRKMITAREELRKKRDPIFKLKKQIRNSIRAAFKRKSSNKTCHTEEIVGCSIEFLVQHLNDTFLDRYGREWDGIEKVHIDHIVPLDKARTEETIIELCHWTNLQLLIPEDNLAKSNK